MTLWCVNILGPDDVLAMLSWTAALEEANALNRYFGRLDETRHEYDPILRAVVVPWPHSAEAHARDLVKQAERKSATQNAGAGAMNEAQERDAFEARFPGCAKDSPGAGGLECEAGWEAWKAAIRSGKL